MIYKPKTVAPVSQSYGRWVMAIVYLTSNNLCCRLRRGSFETERDSGGARKDVVTVVETDSRKNAILTERGSLTWAACNTATQNSMLHDSSARGPHRQGSPLFTGTS